jgi:hypothetical protein
MAALNDHEVEHASKGNIEVVRHHDMRL